MNDVRKYQIALAVLIGLLLLTVLFGFRLKQVAPVVASNIATTRVANYEELMQTRLSESAALTRRLFQFAADVLERSPRTKQILTEWTGLKTDLNQISTDVALLRTEPVVAAKRLIGNGPDRLRNIVRQTVQLAEAVAQLVPETINALRATSGAESGQLQKFDSVVNTFITGDKELTESWSALRTDVDKFIAGVKADIESAKSGFTSKALSVEFSRALWSAFF